MSEIDKENLVSNTVSSMRGICGEKEDEIINRQLSHFLRADHQLGIAIANGLRVAIDEKSNIIPNRSININNKK